MQFYAKNVGAFLKNRPHTPVKLLKKDMATAFSFFKIFERGAGETFYKKFPPLLFIFNSQLRRFQTNRKWCVRWAM